MLRTRTGWRVFDPYSSTLDGPQAAVYVQVDRNPKTIRIELELKKLLAICKAKAPDIASTRAPLATASPWIASRTSSLAPISRQSSLA